jgi:hypothetical protein
MDLQTLDTALQLQAGACRHLGSPLYGDLLDALRADLGGGGPFERLVADWHGDPLRGFLPLRLLGAVHARVLAGAAPDLARFYPSAGGRPRMPDAYRALLELLESQRETLRPALERWPQTNEVRRCGASLAGFLWLARRFGRPLHVREIGASAGLNLLWDRFQYRLGPHRWGGASEVRVDCEWHGPPAPFDAAVGVASRAGCDLEPVDVGDPAQARALESYVWPDQIDRLTPLRAAIRMAQRQPARLERAPAADWLERELREAGDGELFVVLHSAVWIYLSDAEKERILALLRERGRRGPVALLGQEIPPRGHRVELRVRLWPGDQEIHLGYGHPHGRRVHWLEDGR